MTDIPFEWAAAVITALAGSVVWLSTRLYKVLVDRAKDERERTEVVTAALERARAAIEGCKVRGGG